MSNILNKKLLLVEDSASDAALIEERLARTLSFIQYDFMTVPRLSDALQALDTQSFACVLLDLDLLDSSGVSSVSALHSSYPHLPIIVYSGTDDLHLKQQAILCGATFFAVKDKESGFVIKFMIEQALAA